MSTETKLYFLGDGSDGIDSIVKPTEDPSLDICCEVSLVIPVYNRAWQIPRTIQYLNEIMTSSNLRYELIIVDDGSTDSTLEVLKMEQRMNSRIQVLSYSVNKGKGYAVKAGIMKSTARKVMFIDADMDISPTVVVEYIKALETSDLVIASKGHPLSKVNAPLSRRILSKCFRMFVNLMLNLDIADTQSGLKGGSGDILRLLFGAMEIHRYAFDVELLALAQAVSLRVTEMPVELSIDRRFKIIDMFVMFRDLVKISYRFKKKTLIQQELALRVQKRQRRVIESAAPQAF